MATDSSGRRANCNSRTVCLGRSGQAEEAWDRCCLRLRSIDSKMNSLGGCCLKALLPSTASGEPPRRSKVITDKPVVATKKFCHWNGDSLKEKESPNTTTSQYPS